MKQHIHTLLIANRGEIACRIIRTCQRMGIKTVAVFSDADREAPHVKMADVAVFLGAPEPANSYLNKEKILDAALRTGANAIHPGYGFLSENADFAQQVVDAGLYWVGPNPKAIAQMGSKSNAKSMAIAHDVPVVPGYKGEDQSLEKFSEEADKIGFPLLLKAAAGGGGKGMRIVQQPENLREAFQGAKREAMNAFGDDELLMEKYFPSARHIEMQILGDKHGNAIHLLERECTIQRRYQKVFEESPSPVLSDALRQEMGSAAVRLAKALNYDNAGTVEFIFSNGTFYFLEVNTRLQVEHPVTEAITGLDLVELQLEMAIGNKLALKQDDIRANGYAIECRLYAENPNQQFLPGSGKVNLWEPFALDGLRYDSGIESGSSTSIYYDPMVSKIIAHDSSREKALHKLAYALRKTKCLGLTTNQAFLIDVLQNEHFKNGEYDTHFINHTYSNDYKWLPDEKAFSHALLAAACSKCLHDNVQRTELKQIPFGWRNNFYQKQKLTFQYNGTEQTLAYAHEKGRFAFEWNEATYLVIPTFLKENEYTIEINGVLEKFSIFRDGDDFYVHHLDFPHYHFALKNRFPDSQKAKEDMGYVSPMPASVVQILVNKGEQVRNGQSLLILSSMKMENTISASSDGTVEDIFVREGENIEAGRQLLSINS